MDAGACYAPFDWLLAFAQKSGSNGGKADQTTAAPETAGLNAVDCVLVVDDQPDVLEMTEYFLKHLGFEVRAASSGPDALALLAQDRQIDVLLTDVLMPGMTGVELARKVRKLYPTMRIVLASAYPARALEEVNGDSFPLLLKPYTLAQLLSALKHKKPS